ncbi:OadG family transporter subunit [Lutimonas zeaxanthinifaciens]|uniref:OadG family transporter subunit n=1 Tax=Lutimonas zeaxanthinifaciens TaxID=3060215 RepID=UPI00265CB59A|nr:OadG family transporter subunit [Lutimonas sp. YSD2104]WKK65541.1 OadG family transporter subunit [Lutimonas sp. YSD2104]
MTPAILLMTKLSEGYLILFSGLVIVFSALLTLSLFFKFGLPVMLYVYKVITKGPDKKIKDIPIASNEKFTGEEAAVIAAAIHMYLNEQHDFENPILKIKKAEKSYSPWSSKIYGIHHKL